MLIFASLLLAIACVWVLLVTSRSRHLKRHSKLEASCLEAFARVYGQLTPRPDFAMRYAYGFPAFTVTFQTKEQREQFEKSGSNSLFTEAIARLCADRGDRSNAFDAQRAIYFTYGGREEELFLQHPELLAGKSKASK